MYMVGDGASQQSTNPSVARTSVQRRLGSTDAAAISAARTLLSGGGAVGYRPGITVEEIAKFDTSASSHVRDSMDTGKSPTDGPDEEASRVPLPESNRVFLLLGDIARLRERGAVPTVTALAVACVTGSPTLSTSAVGSFYDGGSPLGAVGAGPRCSAFPSKSPRPSGAGCSPASSVDSHAARLQAQQAHALETKVLDVDAAVKKWEAAVTADGAAGASQHVLATIAIVRSLLSSLMRH
jgi:hypothetical protein